VLANTTRELSAALADARRAVVTAAAGSGPGAVIGDEEPCRLVGQALGLDTVSIVAGARPPAVTAEWRRPGTRSPRVGTGRLAAIVAGCGEECAQLRDGRYAVLTMPLRDSHRRLGTLVGIARSTRTFTADELRTAELIAGGAVARASAEPPPPPAPADERPVEQMRLLEVLGGRMARARTEREVAQAVVAELGGLIDHHACRFYLLSPAGDEVVPVAHDGVGDDYEDEPPATLVCRLGEGVAGQAMVDCRARLVPDAATDPYAAHIPGTDDLDESMMVAPMMVDDEPIGVIVLSKLGLDGFDATDLRLLEVVAGQAAAACQTVRLYDSAREGAEVAEALLELGAALAVPTTVAGLAELLARAVERMVDCAATSVWLRDGDELTLAGHVGYTPEEARRLLAAPLYADEAPFRGSLDARRITVATPSAAPALAYRLDTLGPGSTFAVVPVGERAANRAAIVVQRGHRRGRPSARDERMLLGIADQALMALTNRALVAELEASIVATMQSLGAALGAKDEYTGEHAQALVGMCQEVARRLGVTGAGLRDVELAAALHDVGKIGVPAEVLDKPGPLDEEEWRLMRLHPEIGARIMEPVAALDGARELVVACHEHWDGTGYPAGLDGDRIPLGARIILACDALHAMTSDRVYRQAMPMDAAIDELRSGAGGHFDPTVVDALLDVLAASA
jgi:HD-GYP domain-containing protein (c-di-GMP phosphodiesterase class II)/putative methionine-R-sulfoxide reductase with GAF domain